MNQQFQLIGYLQSLAEYQIEYLIIGGVASRIQGATTTTMDLDIMPSPATANLAQLIAMLNELGAARRPSNSTQYDSAPPKAPPEFFVEETHSFSSSYGILDVIMEMPGVGQFDAVQKGAREYSFGEIRLKVANLDDIIASKQKTDRAKDWRAMDALYEARAHLASLGDEYEVPPDRLDSE